METQFRHANRDYIECRDLFEELEEAVGNGEAPTRVNQLQEAVSAKMTAVRQRVSTGHRTLAGRYGCGWK
jgi:predicted metal-dependent hydrolase